MYKHKTFRFLLIILSIIYITNIPFNINNNLYTYGESLEEIKINTSLQVSRQITETTETITSNKVISNRNVSYYNITCYSDLSVMNSITVDEINKIIDYWNYYCGGNSPFTNNGQIFIDAARETGLDPIYILAHAGLESGWGTSYYAKNYHNYFGIGAFDDDPDNAINYSNYEMEDGIIEGAKWIKENYYDRGQTNLYSMRYNNGYHEYCTSNTWVDEITNIIQTSYSLISC